jgi:haloalkane dehalogenase
MVKLPTSVTESLYPFTGRYVDVNGFKMYTFDEGQGPPVVMVHGNPTWSFYYRNLVLKLRDRYRCIVPDHIGCGLSDRPEESAYPWTFERRARDLEALINALDVTEPVTLVVHDWGGMIGMTWAHWNPEKVARIVVLNTAAFHLPSTKSFPWQLWLARDTPVGALLVKRFNAFAGAASWVGCTRNRMDAAMRAAYTAPYDTPHNRLATLKFVQDIPLRQGDPGYALISEVEASLPRFASLPIFIGWGLRDFVFDRHFLARWEREFPAAVVHRYPDCGHYILEDAGAELVDKISDFIDQHTMAGRS